MSSRRHLSVCSVCGDKASGKHYGVMSCDGCRGFFKRSVRRQIQYKCKGDSTCQVDVNRRNQCQACRFQRCLTMKMKPSAVQHERAPRHPPKRPLPSVPPFAHSRLATWTSSSASAPPPPSSRQVTIPTYAAFHHLPIHNISSPFWSHLGPIPSASFNNSFESNSWQNSSTSDLSHSSLDVTTDEKICEIASFVLLESIHWLYLVPSFKELYQSDQNLLIDHSWSIIFLFISAEMRKFLDSTDHESLEDFSLFQSMIKDLIRHSIDSTEFTLLKLIVIFSAPMHLQLHDRFRIEKYRQDALFMLTEYTRNSKYRRLAELLMLLSNIQENMQNIDLEKLFFTHLIQRISMKTLLEKVIEHLPNLPRAEK